MECLNNKGYEPVVSDYNEDDTILKTKGKYDVKIENIGDVSVFIQLVGEIQPGETKCIGISQVPCAIDIPINYSQENGTKKVRLWANKIVCFECACVNA